MTELIVIDENSRSLEKKNYPPSVRSFPPGEILYEKCHTSIPLQDLNFLLSSPP